MRQAARAWSGAHPHALPVVGVRVVPFSVFLVALCAQATCPSAEGASARVGVWTWTEPDVYVEAAGPLGRSVGPSEDATIAVGPGLDWVATMSDAIVSCHANVPHYAPVARGIVPFDTSVPGACALESMSDGRLHATWTFGASSGPNRVGPMRGDGYFS